VLLLKLIASVTVCMSVGWWFKTTPPPDVTPNEQTFNRMMALLTAGTFSAVIALLDRNNVVPVLKLYICCGVFAALGTMFGGPWVVGSTYDHGLGLAETERGKLATAIVGAMVGFVVAKALSRFHRPEKK
jgi:hypothetical protein